MSTTGYAADVAPARAQSLFGRVMALVALTARSCVAVFHRYPCPLRSPAAPTPAL